MKFYFISYYDFPKTFIYLRFACRENEGKRNRGVSCRALATEDGQNFDE